MEWRHQGVVKGLQLAGPEHLSQTSPKIVVHGAGAIGTFIGAGWQSSGLDVTLIGRQWLVDEATTHGLALTDYKGHQTKLDPSVLTVTTDPSVIAEADIVMLCVKSTATHAAAAEINRYATPDAVVLSFQNGISNVDLLRQELRQTVLPGVVPYNVVQAGGGHWHKGNKGQLSAAPHAVLEPVISAVRNRPWSLSAVADMTSLAWGKLLLNLNNPINALSGLTLRQQLSDRNYRRVLAASIREALSVLAAAGITPAQASALPPKMLPRFLDSPNWWFNTIGLRLQKIDDKARSSMADDFARHRPSEIDYLNGEIVALAERTGIAAPVNRAIVERIKAAEQGGRRQWSGEDLVALLG